MKTIRIKQGRTFRVKKKKKPVKWTEVVGDIQEA
jgi:hypothetical protein